MQAKIVTLLNFRASDSSCRLPKASALARTSERARLVVAVVAVAVAVAAVAAGLVACSCFVAS